MSNADGERERGNLSVYLESVVITEMIECENLKIFYVNLNFKI